MFYIKIYIIIILCNYTLLKVIEVEIQLSKYQH